MCLCCIDWVLLQAKQLHSKFYPHGTGAGLEQPYNYGGPFTNAAPCSSQYSPRRPCQPLVLDSILSCLWLSGLLELLGHSMKSPLLGEADIKLTIFPFLFKLDIENKVA